MVPTPSTTSGVGYIVLRQVDTSLFVKSLPAMNVDTLLPSQRSGLEGTNSVLCIESTFYSDVTVRMLSSKVFFSHSTDVVMICTGHD